jgi:hypothetical protein
MNRMKFLLAAIVSLAMVSSLRAEEGTLTLSGGNVLFVTASGTKSYAVQPGGTILDGTKVSAYNPKKVTKDDEETDVSELILVNTADSSKLILINKVPLKVTSTGEGAKITWKPVEK